MKNKDRRKAWLIKRSPFLATAFIYLFVVQSFYGQNSQNMQQKHLNPPFIARTSNFMVLAFHLDLAQAQKLLPDGIIAKHNENGLVNGGLEIYRTDQAYGIMNYSIAFFTLEVKTEESNYGKEGNWAVWGVIDNQTSLGTFKHFYNFSYQHISNISLESDGTIFTAKVGADGAEGLELTLEKNTAQPVKAEGLATILSKSAESNLISIEIPWLAEGHQAEPVSFKINAGKSNALKILQEAKPYYAQVSSNVFSYSKPSN